MVISRENRYGLLGTIAIHLGLLLLLVYVVFTTETLPPVGEEGITVNFGDSENGLGEEEPSPFVSQEEPTTTENHEEVPAIASSAPVVKEKTSPAREEVVTQDEEKTAAIEAAKKKQEKERLKQINSERQRELDKQRNEELERERIAALERKKKEEENRKIAEIENRTKGAFGTSKAGGTGGTGSGTGKSQGITFPGGNQGVPEGDPNSDNYGPGGRGSGTKGTGISYSLSGRTATSTPKPSYPGREDGTVVVKITVDKNGKVTAAEPGQRGTTTMSPDLFEAAKRAALQAKFNIAENAPAFQVGTITYRFIQSQ